MKKFRAKVKCFKDIPKKPGPRGVTTSKVEEIVVKIGPLITKEQMKFWHQLIRNENSKDLTVNYEHLKRTGRKNNDSVVEDNDVGPASLN